MNDLQRWSPRVFFCFLNIFLWFVREFLQKPRNFPLLADNCNRALFTGTGTFLAWVSLRQDGTWKSHTWITVTSADCLHFCSCFCFCLLCVAVSASAGPASPSELSEVTGSLQWFLHLLISSDVLRPKQLQRSKIRLAGKEKRKRRRRQKLLSVVYFFLWSLHLLEAKQTNRQNDSCCVFLYSHRVLLTCRTASLISVGIIWFRRHTWHCWQQRIWL